ncbi:hypothetical protein H0N98_00120 [Candidatus Micrarchaeota archaeon]|nr:hypothetical protein [Candidatus Micrarchaeota archaeon]
MDYKILQPSEGSSKDIGIKNLIRMHGADRSDAESASLSGQKGVLSQDEVKKIARHIQKHMKMKVSESFMKGEENMKPIMAQGLVKILEADMNRKLERFSQYLNVVEQLREEHAKGLEASKNAPAFFDPKDGTVYLVVDNFERIYRERCEERGIDANSAEGKKFRKFLTYLYFCHEEIHKTTAQISPAMKDSTSNRWKERENVLVEYLENEDKSPEKDDRVSKVLNSITDRYDALDACMEGIAHYVGYRVMCEFNYSSWASVEFRNFRDYSGAELEGSLRQEVTDAFRGIRFMEAVQIRTHENPVAYVIKHLPTSVMYVENVNEYLNAIKEGKF